MAPQNFSLDWRSGHQKLNICSVSSSLVEERQLTQQTSGHFHCFFYEDLFRAEDCDVSAVDELLQGLPRLGDEEALSLEHPLSYSELTQAVQQLSGLF